MQGMKNKISISTILNYFSFLPSVQNGGSSRGALGGAGGLGPVEEPGVWAPWRCQGTWAPLILGKKEEITEGRKSWQGKQNKTTLPPSLKVKVPLKLKV